MVVAILIWQGSLTVVTSYQIHEVPVVPLRTPLFIIRLFIPIGSFLFLLQWIVRLNLYTRTLRGEKVEEMESKRAGGEL